jgi:hypothetical protein
VFPRSEKDITLIVLNDTVQRKLYLESSLSGKTLIGNIWPFWPLGVALDMSSPKAYAYPKHTKILFDETAYPYIGSKNWIESEKNLVQFKIGLPLGNIQTRVLDGKKTQLTSFEAFSIGGSYYFSTKQALNIGFTKLVNREATYYYAEDNRYRYTQHSTLGSEILFSTEIKRFHVAAGLHYSNLRIYLLDRKSHDPKYKIQYIGPAINGYFRLSQEVNLGMNYYPSLISTSSGTWRSEYGHILSFELFYTPDIFRPSKIQARRNGNNKK